MDLNWKQKQIRHDDGWNLSYISTNAPISTIIQPTRGNRPNVYWRQLVIDGHLIGTYKTLKQAKKEAEDFFSVPDIRSAYEHEGQKRIEVLAHCVDGFKDLPNAFDYDKETYFVIAWDKKKGVATYETQRKPHNPLDNMVFSVII